MRPIILIATALVLVSVHVTLHGQGEGQTAAAAPGQGTGPRGLDFEAFRTRIQPIFLNKRGEHARCYACHSQGTPLRLQELSPGATSWNEEQSRANFQAMQRVVVPGQPKLSRLLLMPLAHEAGGTEFHPGGKHFASMEEPEVKTLVAWITDVKK